jgi:DNA recombination protein RmuC
MDLVFGMIFGAALGGAGVYLWMRGQKAMLQTVIDAATDKLRFHEQTREDMSLRFKQLSQDILEDKAKRFTEQNQQNIEQILKPLREKIGSFEKQVKDSYELETRDRVALKEQIVQLQQQSQRVSSEANSLATALRGQTKTQGNWGEMILERILELSGLEKGREYETQFSASRDDGKRYRPDAVIHLQGERDIVVDAKVSLSAHTRIGEAADEPVRVQAQAAHVASVRAHLRELGAKDYHALEGIRTLDFVLMFIPNEAAYIEAVRAAPELYEEALAKNIGLVCPSTLLPTLRTINHQWKNEKQNLNAQQIAQEAGKLYDKFVGFEQDLSKIGNALASAQGAYTDARNKLVEGPGNLVRKTEQLKKMGAKASKQLPEALSRQALEDDSESKGDL